MVALAAEAAPESSVPAGGEDFNAGVDFNVVMTSRGEFVEVQGTAEGKPFTKETIDSLLSLAQKGIEELFQIQQTVLDTSRAK